MKDSILLSTVLVMFGIMCYISYRMGRYLERKDYTQAFITATEATYYDGFNDGYNKGKKDGYEKCLNEDYKIKDNY